MKLPVILLVLIVIGTVLYLERMSGDRAGRGEGRPASTAAAPAAEGPRLFDALADGTTVPIGGSAQGVTVERRDGAIAFVRGGTVIHVRIPEGYTPNEQVKVLSGAFGAVMLEGAGGERLLVGFNDTGRPVEPIGFGEKARAYGKVADEIEASGWLPGGGAELSLAMIESDATGIYLCGTANGREDTELWFGLRAVGRLFVFAMTDAPCEAGSAEARVKLDTAAGAFMGNR